MVMMQFPSWLPKKLLPKSTYDIILSEKALLNYSDNNLTITQFDFEQDILVDEYVYIVKAANSDFNSWWSFDSLNSFFKFLKANLTVAEEKVRLIQFYNYSAINFVHEITKTVSINLGEYKACNQTVGLIYEKYFQDLFWKRMKQL